MSSKSVKGVLLSESQLTCCQVGRCLQEIQTEIQPPFALDGRKSAKFV